MPYRSLLLAADPPGGGAAPTPPASSASAAPISAPLETKTEANPGGGAGNRESGASGGSSATESGSGALWDYTTWAKEPKYESLPQDIRAAAQAFSAAEAEKLQKTMAEQAEELEIYRHLDNGLEDPRVAKTITDLQAAQKALSDKDAAHTQERSKWETQYNALLDEYRNSWIDQLFEKNPHLSEDAAYNRWEALVTAGCDPDEAAHLATHENVDEVVALVKEKVPAKYIAKVLGLAEKGAGTPKGKGGAAKPAQTPAPAPTTPAPPPAARPRAGARLISGATPSSPAPASKPASPPTAEAAYLRAASRNIKRSGG